jgi:Fungal protein of unknown function (DUF1774)
LGHAKSEKKFVLTARRIVLFFLQLGYVWHFFSSNADFVNAAAGVGSHFILNNLLQFAFVMLFVRGHFILAELILILNFFNLTSLYFRHNTHPRFIHIPVVSWPLAWTFVALYWDGAIASNATGLAARIVANVAIWAILVFGLFFLITFKVSGNTSNLTTTHTSQDYTIGFALSVLSAAIAVEQFFIKIIALQWIFAFVIMGVLFLATLVVAVPGIFGRSVTLREAQVVPADQERAPLLDDQ